MHSRNPYQHPPDFEVLSKAYPALKQYLIGHTVNFQDEAAQRCLTKAILHHDFNLTVELPSDRLCPPVPNRLNYVLWIQDIVQAHSAGKPRRIGNESTVVQGVDIGTGASAIYPLLACTLEPSWRFVATELDPSSFTNAQKNVTSNGLGDRVRVVKVDAAGKDGRMQGLEAGLVFGFDRLFENVPGAGLGLEHEEDEYDALTIEFTMCNPPFYSTLAEVEAAKGGWDKEEMPSGVCTGAPVEMITPGGEAQFVGQMIRESIRERGENDEMGEDPSRKRRREESDQSEPPPTLTTPVSSPSRLPSRTLSVPRHLPSPGTPCKDQAQLEPTGCPQTTRLQQKARSRLRSRWYTSMLGKLSSVTDVVDVIRGYQITNYAITEFVQGQTRRWAVGWSLGAFRMHDEISRIDYPNPTLQRVMPPRNILHFPIPESILTSSSYDSISDALRSVLLSIEDAFVEEHGPVQEDQAQTSSSMTQSYASGIAQHRLPPVFLVRASRDSWSRSARRKRGRGDDVGPTREPMPDELETTSGFFASAALVCIVCFSERETQERGEPKVKRLGLEFQWVYGWDRVLFESFVSHVGRRATGG